MSLAVAHNSYRMNWLEFFSVYLNITATWQWTNVYWHYLLSHVLYGIHSHLTDDYEMYNKCRVWKVQCILNNDWYSRSVQDLMGRQMYSSCVCVCIRIEHTLIRFERFLYGNHVCTQRCANYMLIRVITRKKLPFAKELTTRCFRCKCIKPSIIYWIGTNESWHKMILSYWLND